MKGRAVHIKKQESEGKNEKMRESEREKEDVRECERALVWAVDG